MRTPIRSRHDVAMGLGEQKKAATGAEIGRQAWRLVREHGYEGIGLLREGLPPLSAGYGPERERPSLASGRTRPDTVPPAKGVRPGSGSRHLEQPWWCPTVG